MRYVKALLGFLAVFIAVLSIGALLFEDLPGVHRSIIGLSGLLAAFVTWLSIRTLK